jgi:steroid delta-isomerase-like uncharacterized protein
MTTQRQAMEEYIDALVKRANFADFFTDDVTVSVEWSEQRADGREAAEQLIRYLHEVAFDGRPEVKSLLVDGDHGALEAEFVGTHTAEFAGIPATGKDIRVPYAVAYDIREGKIAALRIYMPMSVLVEQLAG